MVYLILLLFLFLLPSHTFAQNNNNATIGVGSTLTAITNTTKPWLSSPSGDFAFGFQQLQAGTDDFMLCIWYAKLPEPTVVWHANTSAVIPRGSSVRVDADFGLILRDPQGNILWTPDGGLIGVGEVDHGFLNDTGKFFLVGSDSKVVWDTFAHPTDTLLPTQVMEIDKMLISRRSEANFSQGRFYLRILETGDLVLSTKSFSTNLDFENDYYNTHTASDLAVPTSYKLIFSELGSLYIFETSNKTTIQITPPLSIYSENYLRLSLNFDGVLSLNRIPRKNNSTGNQTWISTWSQPENMCTSFGGNHGSGACGYNSMCSLDANTKRPICKCPPGFSLLDPSDEYGSCKPNHVRTTYDQDLYEMIEIENADWPNNDIENIYPCGKDECKIACLNDCFCGAAIHGDNSCWKKRTPLSNGVTDNTIRTAGFLKVSKNPDTLSREFPENKKKKKNQGSSLILAESVMLGTSVFINFLFIANTCFGFFFIYKRKIKKLNPPMQSNLHCFLYKELVEATHGFRKEIGRGASAIVYKGEMPVGSGNIVAVKKLDRVAQDSEKEFKAEVNVIGQTHHKHLVRLLGYCNEAQHHLLVYEYMSNGTVANFLFSNLRPSWGQRTKIALGIARGLTYLHEECSIQIIHCDIKPQNILLDDYYNARISDFGLAKLLRMNESRTQTNIRGTKGYIAPEWFNEKKVTAKVDVYSFGILLVEIITCSRTVKNTECGDEVVLVDWFTDCFQENKLNLLVENDEEALNDMEKVDRFVMTAIWCIQKDPPLRPTMRKVCQMLEGIVQVHVPPNPYPFTSIVSSV